MNHWIHSTCDQSDTFLVSFKISIQMTLRKGLAWRKTPGQLVPLGHSPKEFRLLGQQDDWTFNGFDQNDRDLPLRGASI